MKRRALLSLCGAGVAALAGCTDQPPGSGADQQDDDQPDGQPSDSPAGSPTSRDRQVAMGESATVDGATLRVEDPRVHPTVVQDASAWQSLRVPDGQFLVVDVTTDGSVPERLHDLSLTVTVDGEPLADTDPTLVVEGEDPGGPYSPQEWNGRQLAFPVPAKSHESVAVRWERGDTTVRWPLGESPRASLAAAPSFRVEHLSASRTAENDVALDLQVANDGARDARFQAWVSFDAIEDASSIVAMDVPAGGTASYADVPPILHYEGAEVVTVVFRAGGEERRVELEVPPASEPTTTSATTNASGGSGDRSGSGGPTPAPEPRTATADTG